MKMVWLRHQCENLGVDSLSWFVGDERRSGGEVLDTLDAGSTEDLAGIVVNCGELREILGRYT